MINANKAVLNTVEISVEDFLAILSGLNSVTVLTAKMGFIQKKYRYLFVHNGLNLYTDSAQSIELPAYVDIIVSNKIVIPDPFLT